MTRKSTQQEFLEKCIDVWDDLYDLSKVIYKGNKVKVLIGCKVDNHGFWEAIPASFVNKPFRGCPICGKLKASNSRRKVPKEKEKEIIERYVVYKQSENFIAKALGFGRDSIYGVLKRNNVKKRNPREAGGGLTESEINKLVTLYKENEQLTMADLARKFNIANGTVRSYFDERKIKVRERGIPIELHKEIIERYNNCEKIRPIARDLGFDPKSITQVLIENNVKTGTLVERFGEQIKKDYKEGKSARLIGEQLNTTENSVLYVLEELNIKRRSNSEAKGGMPHNLDEEVGELYVNELLDMRSIGRKFGFSKTSIKKSLIRSGIPIRTNSEAQRIIQHLKGWDSLEDLLTDKKKYEESCYVYLFKVKNYSKFCKPGISNDYYRRAMDEPKLYGSFESAWYFDTRREARFCELAVLQSTANLANCPNDLLSISGAYEIRECSISEMKSLISEIVDDFNFSKEEGISIYKWAMDNIEMSDLMLEEYSKKEAQDN